jgi:hypothetical protein
MQCRDPPHPVGMDRRKEVLMPNRIIKETIKTSENIDLLTWFEECMFYRMIVTADDFGCLDGRAIVLRNELFPTKDNVSTKDIDKALAKMKEVGLIHIYVNNGHPYIFLLTWMEHQRVRNKRRRFPAPTFDGELLTDDGQETADCLPESNPIQSESNPNPNTNSASGVLSEQESWFMSFWEMYPRKVDKKNSRKVFDRVCKNEETYGKIMIGLGKQIPTWKDPKYIPHPSTWLNGERWNDETAQPVFNVPFPEVMNEF